MLRWLVILATALAFGALSGVAAYQKVQPQGGSIGDVHWREIAWPFPRDACPAGRAFRCESDACGAGIELYVRPKIGFCNCDSGVADDDEVDRVADLDMISPKFVPLAPGNVVHVGGMSGRSRAYDLDMSDGSHHAALGIALSHHCDLLVAVAQGRAEVPELQDSALKFLASQEVTHWMTAALGGP